jgi:hypothetical protein
VMDSTIYSTTGPWLGLITITMFSGGGQAMEWMFDGVSAGEEGGKIQKIDHDEVGYPLLRTGNVFLHLTTHLFIWCGSEYISLSKILG